MTALLMLSAFVFGGIVGWAECAHREHRRRLREDYDRAHMLDLTGTRRERRPW